MDPELYELTQAKLDVSGGSSRVVDAFARLMSTVEKTSTSTRSVSRTHSATRRSHTTVGDEFRTAGFLQAFYLQRLDVFTQNVIIFVM